MPISSDKQIKIKDSSFPKPFSNGLEFNAPSHGTWNIVHIGYAVPSAHQIYICADNCLRGVVMTAAEMGALDRFSSVVLEEDDMLHSGRLEESTTEGITEVLRKLDKVPPVVIVFPVCVHKFMGCDMNHIYKTLEERFPDTKFVRAFMDPVMQKRGTTPDQRLRKALMDIIPEGEEDRNTVAFVGCDMSPAKGNDINNQLINKGIHVLDSARTESLEEYYSIGSASRFICCYPAGRMGSEILARRLRRPLYYLPMDFNKDRIIAALELLGLDVDGSAVTDAERATEELKTLIADTPIAIDYTAVPRPLSLARFLLENGFNLKTVYLDGIDPDEEEDYNFLKEDFPELILHSTIHIMDRRPVRPDEKVLAIGQKAAWFEGTEYFVNIVEGAGLWGFGGIEELMSLMKDAYNTPKDIRDIIPRKGLGCSSVYE
ncbi:MAG: nitrogenase component 1 [Saccharofermentans sp.]|nr:nitrogenase component 1 [Saccharofermentans sp.]